jgi:hypothetical protein
LDLARKLFSTNILDVLILFSIKTQYIESTWGHSTCLVFLIGLRKT